MQIEYDKDMGVVFIHIDIREDKMSWVEAVEDHLTSFGHRVIKVPNGKPMRLKHKPLFFLFKNDDVTLALAKKFADAKPGQIIPLSDEEWEAYNTDFQTIPQFEEKE